MALPRVLVVEGHPLLRRGLVDLLTSEGHAVVGDCGDGHEGLRLLEVLDPDLVVVDIAIPGLPSLELVRLAADRPRTRVLVLTSYVDSRYDHAAYRAGAHGCAIKDDAPREIALAAREVLSGRPYASPALMQGPNGSTSDAPPRDPTDLLTPREHMVLSLVAAGCSRDVIAERLGISSRTVEIVRAGAMRKLALVKPLDLVQYAIRLGLTPAEG